MPDAGSGVHTLSPAVLDALRVAARQRGYVSVDELERVLPVKRLSPEDLARTIETIEDAGIPIELDRALQRPRRPAPAEREFPATHAAAEPDTPRVPRPEARPSPQPFSPAGAPDHDRDAAGPNAATIRRLGFDDEARVSAFVIGALLVVCAAMIYVSGLLV